MMLYVVASILVMGIMFVFVVAAVSDAQRYRELYEQQAIAFELMAPEKFREWKALRRQ